MKLLMTVAMLAMGVLGQSSSSQPVPLPTVASLSVPSDSVVWTLVADRMLFRSTDQGADWERRPLPTGAGAPIASFSFVDDQEGWLSSVGSPATQCQSQDVAIWHTTDGGDTWQTLDGLGIDQAGCKGELTFVDSLQGFLDVWGQNMPPVVYATSDGGETWSSSQALPDPPGVTTGQGGFQVRVAGHVRQFGSTLLVPAVAAQGLVAVYESDDGGATWAYAASLPIGDATIGMATATHWLQLVFPGQSQETTDAGATWFTSASDYSQAAPVGPQVLFGSPDVGYATVRGRISQTLDAGQHWTTLSTPGTCGTAPPC